MSTLALRLDLRDIPVRELDAAVAQAGDYPGFMMTAWQWTAWSRGNDKSSVANRLLIVVPDFLYYARLGSTGQAKEIIRLPRSLPKVVQSAIKNVVTNTRNVPGLATGNFWSAAETLTAFDLGLLPRNFAGEVVLQYNLADFTWLFDRHSFLQRFSNLTNSSWGVATQQPAKALSACARWNLAPARIVFTSGTLRVESEVVSLAKAERFRDTKFTLDLTQWPTELLCGDGAGELRRDYDDEWLLSYEAGICLMKQTGVLTS